MGALIERFRRRTDGEPSTDDLCREAERVEDRLREAERELDDAVAEKTAADAAKVEAERLDDDSYFGSADPAEAQRVRAEAERRVIDADRRVQDAERRVARGRERARELKALVVERRREGFNAMVSMLLDREEQLERALAETRQRRVAVEAERDDAFLGPPSRTDVDWHANAVLQGLPTPPMARNLERAVAERVAQIQATRREQELVASEAVLAVEARPGTAAYSRWPNGSEAGPVRLS